MSVLERTGLTLLRGVDPERAHGLALGAIRMGLGPSGGPAPGPAVRLGALALPNPVGLAAGFDKNAVAVGALSQAGFGWIEVGAATPRPQRGNPRPRLFRLAADGAAINRFGFNNDGVRAIAARLAARPPGVPVGLNLGANKDSPDRAADYAEVLRIAGPVIDFATVNVSSPNTQSLRDLQDADPLRALLGGVMETNAALARPVPILLKIAPDLSVEALAAVARAAEDCAVTAIVATNTTLSRDGLQGRHRRETGGMSGRPLFGRSTRILARLSGLTDLPLVGVGGIASPEDAIAKIEAGASAVQLYTALAYDGLGLVRRIAEGLRDHVARQGLPGIDAAVASNRAPWL